MGKPNKPFDGKGYTFTHAHLFGAAKRMLDSAKDEKNVRLKFYTMSSMLFSAITMEAYLNFLGNILLRCWKEIEYKLSPKAKLTLIEEILEVNLDFGNRPFQSFNELFKYRNWMVHGRTEEINEPVVVTNRGRLDFDFKADWEKWTTYEKAKKFYDDMKNMIIELDKFQDTDIVGLGVLSKSSVSELEAKRLIDK